MLLIIAISTFVCITLGMMGVYWLVYRPQSASTERLKRLGGRSGVETSPSGLVTADKGSDLAERLASPLSRLVPPSAAEAKKLQKQLMHAGFGRLMRRSFFALFSWLRWQVFLQP